MVKLAIVIVAAFVAVVAAAPNSLLNNLESLQHMKRAATILMPLESVKEQKKAISRTEFKQVMTQLDVDKDGMLNVEELKLLLLIGGIPKDHLEINAAAFMTFFDNDKNNKLNINETLALLRFAGM